MNNIFDTEFRIAHFYNCYPNFDKLSYRELEWHYIKILEYMQKKEQENNGQMNLLERTDLFKQFQSTR